MPDSEKQTVETGSAKASWEVQLIAAYQQDALDLDYQTEILLWDSTVGDGIDDYEFE